MHGYPGEVPTTDYNSRAPVLLAASGTAAMLRAERTVAGSGLRIGARLPIAEALEGLKSRVSMTAVWVEVDRDGGDHLDELLGQLNHDVTRGFYPAIVSTMAELVDPIISRVGESPVEVVVDATEIERIAALATALSYDEVPLRLSDIGTDQSAERLRQLSEEVSRIASTLARISAGPNVRKPSGDVTQAGELPPLPADTIAKVIRARRMRGRYFDETLFADPAWDMMLDLLQAEIRQHRVPVSSLCIAAAVPATTALRWLKTLVSQGLFLRRADPHDGRRVFVELAPDTSVSLRRYFAEVEGLAAI